MSTTDQTVSTRVSTEMLHLRVSTATGDRLRALAAENGSSLNAEARAILENEGFDELQAELRELREQCAELEARALTAESPLEGPGVTPTALTVPEAPLLPPELLAAVQAFAKRRARGLEVTLRSAVQAALEFAVREDGRRRRDAPTGGRARDR